MSQSWSTRMVYAVSVDPLGVSRDLPRALDLGEEAHQMFKRTRLDEVRAQPSSSNALQEIQYPAMENVHMQILPQVPTGRGEITAKQISAARQGL